MMHKPHHHTLLLVLALGGCSEMQQTEVSFDGVHYTFPSDHIRAHITPDEGSPFIRIRPPGENFDLLHSASTWTRKNWQGAGTPLVSTINDHPSPEFSKHNASGGVTVCRSDQPFYSCGLQLKHTGVVWSVVFNADQVTKSDQIRVSALRILEQYRK